MFWRWQQLCMVVAVVISINENSYRLRDHSMSTARIQRALLGIQISILNDSAGQGRFGMPSQVSSYGREIYQTLGLVWNRCSLTMTSGQQFGSGEDAKRSSGGV